MLSHVRTFALACLGLLGLFSSVAFSDHRHSGGHYHGGHFHPGIGPGFGYRGSGIRVYIGPGIGSGYYGPNYGYGSVYSRPQYYVQPSYVVPSYVVPSTPTYQFVEPTSGVYATRRPAAAPPTYDGGPIVLTNPAANDSSVEYFLNGTRFTIKPGQSQKFNHDREWIVEFDRGTARARAQYALKSATYKFKPTSKGWELFEAATPATSTAAPLIRDSEAPAPRDIVIPEGPAKLESPNAAATPAEKPATSEVPKVASELLEQVVPQRKLPKPPAQ